jgi:hypothetical protein
VHVDDELELILCGFGFDCVNACENLRKEYYIYAQESGVLFDLEPA